MVVCPLLPIPPYFFLTHTPFPVRSRPPRPLRLRRRPRLRLSCRRQTLYRSHVRTFSPYTNSFPCTRHMALTNQHNHAILDYHNLLQYTPTIPPSFATPTDTNHRQPQPPRRNRNRLPRSQEVGQQISGRRRVGHGSECCGHGIEFFLRAEAVMMNTRRSYEIRLGSGVGVNMGS